MSPPFTAAEWSRCVDYHIDLERRHVFGRNYPGDSPPRYREFRRLYERRDPRWVGRDAHTGTQQRSPRHEPPSTDGLISMPPEVLTSFFNAQYRMVELMVGANGGRMGRPLPRQFAPPKPKTKKTKSKGKRRDEGGGGRGRGSNRGRFGRGRSSRSTTEIVPTGLLLTSAIAGSPIVRSPTPEVS